MVGEWPARQSAEPRALEDDVTRLAIAARAAEIGIWDWDLATGRMDYSPRARAICGFSDDEPLDYEKVRALVHPDDLPRTSELARHALDPDVRAREPYEYRILLPDGSTRWVLAHGEAEFEEVDGAARAVRYLGTIQDVTARHRLEEDRARSEQRLRLAIDAGRMAVWEVIVAEDRLVGTPELNRLLGFPEGKALDIDEVRAGYYPGERERLQAIGQEVLARGERFLETEYRYYRPDGELRWLMLRAEMLFGDDGAPTRAVGVLIDVTDRKKTEEALRTSEARLNVALQAAGAGVFEWDARTGDLQWSPQCYALYGLDPSLRGQALHEAWLRVVHPDDVEDAQAAGFRALNDGEGFGIDFRVRLPSGDIRWIRSHGTVVKAPDGKVEKVTGINIDVTAQHRGEESLRARAEETERQRDRIYQLSNDLFAVAGFDGYLKVVNPAWGRLLGYEEAELLAGAFIERIHPEDRARTAETVGLLRSGHDVRQFENRVLDAQGRAVWINWSAVAEGDLFYAIGRDVTRDKEREEALRQAQKMEAVGHLTGGIAHDFNNLLQAVHGNLDLIRRRSTDERLTRWAEQGLQAAERGSRLTAQLLAFSRAQKLELRPVRVTGLIEGMRDLLARTLGPMIRIRLDLADGPDTVLGDPTQLEMAILNLAINARDAMPEGGALTIRTEPCGTADLEGLEPGDYLKIEVADTGSGMPPEVAEQAFDPFFTTKGVGKGTGLGLSQVYGMARQAGGTARIASAAGKGTTVTLYLRCTGDKSAEEPASAARAAARARAAATVLVVDDDSDVRRFLADSLGDLGYRVEEAEDGPSALTRIEGGAPDLLLVDYAMPGMTGAEVADRARSLRPDLPVLFASGYSDTAAIEKAVGPSATVLRKPFRIDELEEAVAAALKP
ncbi:MAG: PAS domain-containing protein [Allosphingosinicella sp.]|uniref:hybrid sensor histidine kinase/response regulator n=1 Tax=Allosphingosinicella sp. TaxID=2823234 RepID=UPI003945E6B3